MSTTTSGKQTKVAESIAHLDDLTSGPRPIGRNGRPKTSRYRGVSFKARRSRPWEVTIRRQKGGNREVVGYFKIEEDAGRAWDRAAIECGRPRWQLNFPDEADVNGLFLAAADIEANTPITAGANLVGPAAMPRGSAMSSEAKAISAIAAVLDGLDDASCRRVIGFFMGHFGKDEATPCG